MKAHRLVLAAAAGASVLALTGCAPTGDVAAEVGKTKISSSDVDFLAKVYCAESNKAAAAGGDASQAQPVTKQSLRASMLTTLLQTEIEAQLGDAAKVPVDQASVTQQLAQYDGVFKATSAADQKRYLGLYRKLFEASSQFQALVTAQATAASPGTQPTTEQLQAVAAQDIAAFVSKTHLEIDPVYGVDKKLIGSSDPSLSVPVSSFAKKATATQPDAAWIGSLPKNQRCG